MAGTNHSHRPGSHSVSYTAPGLDPEEPDDSIANLFFTHPKNSLGVPLATATDGDTGALVVQHLVELPGKAKRGAQALGLIDLAGNLTGIGRHVVSTASQVHGSSRAGLEAFEDLSGSSTRFVDVFPEWEFVCRRIFLSYRPAYPILAILQHKGPLVLSGLVEELADAAPKYTAETFLQVEVETSSDPLADVDLEEGETYRGQAIYQLKSMLYHAGMLTYRGADTSRVVPSADIWKLEKPVHLPAEVTIDVA